MGVGRFLDWTRMGIAEMGTGNRETDSEKGICETVGAIRWRKTDGREMGAQSWETDKNQMVGTRIMEEREQKSWKKR